MSIDDLTALITVILAISLASERLVTLLKTIFPALADNTTGQVHTPESDNKRQLIVMLLAVLSSWVTSAFLAHGEGLYWLTGSIPIKGFPHEIPVYLMALLASGGSAFWASLLGYTKTVKDIKKEQISQEKMASEQMLSERTTKLAELKR